MPNRDLHAVFMRDFAQTQTSLHESMHHALRAIRNHLDMDAAFVSEFRDGKRWFLAVDQRRGLRLPLKEGAQDPQESSLCYYIAQGDAPQVMLDAREDPIGRTIAGVQNIPVGAHISVPIRNAQGGIFGMLCCFSRSPRPRMPARNMRLVRTFADIIGSNIAVLQAMSGPSLDLRTEIATLLTAGRIEPVFQPICGLESGLVKGYEGLSRFPDMAERSVEEVFIGARRAGLGVELELQAARHIMAAAANTPLQRGFVTLNLSHRSLQSDALVALYEADLSHLPHHGYIVEVSEQEAVENFDTLRNALKGLRSQGLKIAIDDVGAGQSGLKHLLKLAPEMIKLDRSVIAGLSENREARAIVGAMVAFTRETGADLVAEGIETEAEKQILIDLGVGLGQGYLLGRPEPLPRCLKL